MRVSCRRIGVSVVWSARVAIPFLNNADNYDERSQHHEHMRAATKLQGTLRRPTGIFPKRICGSLPLLTLSRSSSTMSWVMSTCMAWMGVVLASLEPMSLSGAPKRAMPPGGSTEAAMARELVDCRRKRRNEV